MNHDSDFHNACALILAHCPLDTAREFARQGLEEWEPDRQRTLCQFILYETKRWNTALSANIKKTFRRVKGDTLQRAGEEFDATPTLAELGLE